MLEDESSGIRHHCFFVPSLFNPLFIQRRLINRRHRVLVQVIGLGRLGRGAASADTGIAAAADLAGKDQDFHPSILGAAGFGGVAGNRALLAVADHADALR